jgi:hypothetical protein
MGCSTLRIRHNSRQKAHFAYEIVIGHLTAINPMKSAISEFWVSASARSVALKAEFIRSSTNPGTMSLLAA